jgi:hypothetical protein
MPCWIQLEEPAEDERESGYIGEARRDRKVEVEEKTI